MMKRKKKQKRKRKWEENSFYKTGTENILRLKGDGKTRMDFIKIKRSMPKIKSLLGLVKDSKAKH
jgi:hypothetical protein